MIKKVFNIIKKLILSVLLIYAYNKLTLPFDLIIPINIITVVLVTFCGIPSLIMIIIFSLTCI